MYSRPNTMYTVCIVYMYICILYKEITYKHIKIVVNHPVSPVEYLVDSLHITVIGKLC